jgi:hypothetical protein
VTDRAHEGQATASSATRGLGVLYTHGKYTYDQRILVFELGGEITYKGFQVFLTFLL